MRRAVAIPALLAALAGVGCGGGDDVETGSAPASIGPVTTTSGDDALSPPFHRLEEPRCDPAAADCAEARGEIAYVERVDPDGDGDAHFVLVSAAGVTAPGITVVDVRADLRPRPLPGPGDLLAAAGPVYEGSYGQRQIEAVAIDYVRVRRGDRR